MGNVAHRGREVWESLPTLTPIAEGMWECREHMFYEGLLIREGVYRIDGGEVMAHAIWLAEHVCPGRSVSALNTVFPREGRHEVPTRYEVDVLHAGRSFAFVNVRATQPDRGVIGHAQLVVTAELAGPTHQGAFVPDIDWAASVVDPLDMLVEPAHVVGAHRTGDPEPGDPLVRLRLPIPDDMTDATQRRMYVTQATDHLGMAPALRPHSGIGFRTKRSFYTAPIAHSVRFWRDIPIGAELRFDLSSPVMVEGLGVASGHCFDANGVLVASCSMDVVARATA